MLREGRRFTQEQVRDALRIDVSHFELRKCSPTCQTIMRLSDFYGVDFKYIVSLAEQVDCGIISEDELYLTLRKLISDGGAISSVK